MSTLETPSIDPGPVSSLPVPGDGALMLYEIAASVAGMSSSSTRAYPGLMWLGRSTGYIFCQAAGSPGAAVIERRRCLAGATRPRVAPARRFACHVR